MVKSAESPPTERFFPGRIRLAIMRAMSAFGRVAALVTLLVLSLSSVVVAAPAAPLSPHAFRKVVERTRSAVVPVVSTPRGTAVLVGVGGDLLAPARLVRDGRILVELEGNQREAVLVHRDEAIGLAMLKIEATPGASFPAAHVGSASRLDRGDPLVALAFDRRGKLITHAGSFEGRRDVKGIEHLRTSVDGPIGSALFNRRGELVAVHAGRRRATIPIDAVKQRFAPADRP